MCKNGGTCTYRSRGGLIKQFLCLSFIPFPQISRQAADLIERAASYNETLMLCFSQAFQWNDVFLVYSLHTHIHRYILIQTALMYHYVLKFFCTHWTAIFRLSGDFQLSGD